MSDLDYGTHYRQWHDESDAHMEEMVAGTTSLLAPYLPPVSDALEIGCGMGFAMIALQRAGFTVRGVDIDTSQIEASKRRGLAVEKIGDLLEYLTRFEGKFGLVLMMDVLEHLPVSEQIPVLTAIHKALRPGGRLIVQVPNANSILAARWRYIDFTHTSSFTEHSIRFAFNNAGFQKVALPTFDPDPRRPSLRSILRNRWDLKRWMVRKFWRIALEVELGEDVSKLPLSLNLLAISDKEGRPKTSPRVTSLSDATV